MCKEKEMDNTAKFSGKAESYQSARPGYPKQLAARLAELGMKGADAADVGAGTGIFSRFLREELGCSVWAVEPNGDMRRKAEQLLGNTPGIFLREGTAEATGLPSGSVSLVTAAQAFHWFSPQGFRRECLRILRPEHPQRKALRQCRAAGQAVHARQIRSAQLPAGHACGQSGHICFLARKILRPAGLQKRRQLLHRRCPAHAQTVIVEIPQQQRTKRAVRSTCAEDLHRFRFKAVIFKVALHKYIVFRFGRDICLYLGPVLLRQFFHSFPLLLYIVFRARRSPSPAACRPFLLRNKSPLNGHSGPPGPRP